ncbi:MAG: 5-oxoprolinase subunit PxpA [Planctomycetota bacterium]
MSAVDMNADVGETSIDQDRLLLPYLTSCNVCCGAHAGDAELIVATIREAIRLGVSIGAHPSYPDRPGFGRRFVPLSEERLASELLFQIGAVKSASEAFGRKLSHIKPHGALYHAVRSAGRQAEILIEVAERIAPDAAIVGQAGSPLGELATRRGFAFRHEGFADRRYQTANALVPRTDSGALIETESDFRDHLAEILSGRIRDVAGRQTAVPIDTICLHGDTPTAVRFAQIARAMMSERYSPLGKRDRMSS